MKIYYDFHIHSCLSPCGDKDMTPNNIVNMSLLNGLDVIAITDHNSCKNCEAVVEAGKRSNLLVIPGMELCTNEEIHVVCLFPNVDMANKFSDYVSKNTVQIPNRPDIFGEQIIMDSLDNEIGRESNVLINAANISVNDVCDILKGYGGAAFPSHIDKNSYSIIASLGDIPVEAGFNCAELTEKADITSYKKLYPQLQKMQILINSDAHYLESMPEKNHCLDLNINNFDTNTIIHYVRNGKI